MVDSSFNGLGNRDLKDQLAGYLGEFDISLPDEVLESLLDHLGLVLEKNQVMNLTRITDVQEALILHIVDSLLYLPYLPDNGSVLDIGTGAGYPGIPLALGSDLRFVLMDSVTKKVKACDEFVRSLGLGDRVSCTNERAEAFGVTHRGEFQCVVARAVSSIPVVMEYAEPLLEMGGTLILSRGPLSEEDLKQARRAANILGFKFVRRESIDLPKSEGHRELLVFENNKKSQIHLPRRVGEARKDPVA